MYVSDKEGGTYRVLARSWRPQDAMKRNDLVGRCKLRHAMSNRRRSTDPDRKVQPGETRSFGAVAFLNGRGRRDLATLRSVKTERFKLDGPS